MLKQLLDDLLDRPCQHLFVVDDFVPVIPHESSEGDQLSARLGEELESG